MPRVQNKEITVETVQEEKKEKEFPVQELLENSQELFGYYPEVLKAALFGKKIEKITINEAQNCIQKFLKKEVH